MKSLFFFFLLNIISIITYSQVNVEYGSDLTHPNTQNLNRIININDSSFFALRIRKVGAGTSFFVEKYNKNTLVMEFSRDLGVANTGYYKKIEEFKLISNKVYVFFSQFNNMGQEMKLLSKSVSLSGDADVSFKELFVIKTKDNLNVDFQFAINPSKTKILIKALHKVKLNDPIYSLDFGLFDGENMNLIWLKSYSDARKPIRIYLDDDDNIYYHIDYESNYNNNIFGINLNSNYRSSVFVIKKEDKGDYNPMEINLRVKDDKTIDGLRFFNSTKNEISIIGFKDYRIPRKGMDGRSTGICLFKMNTISNKIEYKNIDTTFFEKIVKKSGTTEKDNLNSIFHIDYVYKIKEKYYVVGQQMDVTSTITGNASSSQTFYIYRYKNIFVTTLDNKGEILSVDIIPNKSYFSIKWSHYIKQYIAYPSSNGIYLLYNSYMDNINKLSSNYNYEELKTVKKIHGSDFVYSYIPYNDKEPIKHDLIFKNDNYCFNPIVDKSIDFIPPSDCELFVTNKDPNKIILYTDDRGKDRFAKIKLE